MGPIWDLRASSLKIISNKMLIMIEEQNSDLFI